MNKWKSKYSPNKLISTHQYILEIVCENLARKDSKELPLKFWELKDWKWKYIKQSNRCKTLREKHGEDKLLDFVLKNNIWSLAANWIDEALTTWQVTEAPKVPELDIITKPSLGQTKSPKTNLFKGL